jgi:hypothetical protein
VSEAPFSDGVQRPERGRDGRFIRGNCGGPGGGRLSAKMSRLRLAVAEAVTVRDVQDITRALIERARQGDAHCARLVLGYAVGLPESHDVLDMVGALERKVEELCHERSK